MEGLIAKLLLQKIYRQELERLAFLVDSQTGRVDRVSIRML
jgi:hypothetical protein